MDSIKHHLAKRQVLRKLQWSVVVSRFGHLAPAALTNREQTGHFRIGGSLRTVPIWTIS